VKTFLDSNPHFVAAGPTTTQSKGNLGSSDVSRVDITKLDMSKPKDREIYRQWKSNQGR